MTRTHPHRVLAGHLTFPECPRWRDNQLWFVDGPTIKNMSHDGLMRTVFEIDGPLLMGLCFTSTGDLLVGTCTGRKILQVTPAGSVTEFADLSALTEHLINEVIALADGTVIANEVGYDLLRGAQPQAARLISVSPQRRLTRTGSPLIFANGLVATNEGRGLLVAEHGTGVIWHFNLVAEGELDAGDVVCTVPTQGLDGIASATDGSIWYADVVEGSVSQISVSGKVLQSISTGYRHATSCVLNGDESVLFVTVVDSMPDADFHFANDGAVLAIQLKQDT